jgi:hypothetical protein
MQLQFAKSTEVHIEGEPPPNFSTGIKDENMFSLVRSGQVFAKWRFQQGQMISACISARLRRLMGRELSDINIKVDHRQYKVEHRRRRLTATGRKSNNPNTDAVFSRDG